MAELALVSRMRAATHAQHAAAEQSGIIAAMITGRISALGYALYLRNLLPAYQNLERLIANSAALAAIARLTQSALRRAPSLSADLDALLGLHWHEHIPLLPVAKRYAARVALAGSRDDRLLVAHAYTRYLGDLSGGQLLRRQLARRFGPRFPLHFTEFPAIREIGAFTTEFRAAINRVGTQLGDDATALVLQEARAAFELNITLSLDVDSAARNMEKMQGDPRASGLAFPCQQW